MKFTETGLAGAYLVQSEPNGDDRGHFARAYCRNEFAAAGIEFEVVQANLVYTREVGTVRGLHWQYPPAAEAKLVRCTRGAVFDVMVDLRPESPTFGRHVAVRLSAENLAAVYLPSRFAHGYQSLVADSEVGYQVSHEYTPQAEGGLPPGDPELGIAWPLPIAVISPRDAAWPSWAEQAATLRTRMALRTRIAP